MVVSRGVELVWFEFGLVLHSSRPYVCLVVDLLRLGLMSGLCFVVFFVYFEHIFHVILTCPLTIDNHQTS
jgi:hypothetical protein